MVGQGLLRECLFDPEADSILTVDQRFPRNSEPLQDKNGAMINIAMQEDLPNALSVVTGSMKALLLGEPNRWVRGSDTGMRGWFTGPQPIHAKHPSLPPEA
jgi:hypothetical protein